LPATVMAIFTSDRGFLATGDSAATNDQVGLVLDKSSFYAEGGGQETDTGTIEFLDEQGTVTGVFAVTDVQIYGGFVLHKGVVEQGSLTVGSHVNCKVDYDRRRLVAPNHSMTHVLNAALRQVLGPGVEQRGSLCNEEKLRFDFSHKKALSVSELRQVEEICQSVVAQSQPVQSVMMALDEARQLDGVRAVFGEVYPDPVRVIRIGDDTSVEFCGGTHIDNTIEAEAFVLVEETAVAKGIRRISAVTKQAAVDAMENGSKFLHRVQAAEALDESTVDLDKQAGAIRKDLDAAFISAALKSELRGRIEVIQKKASEASKKALQQRVGAVVQSLKQVVHDSLAANEPYLVWSVDIGADAKASQTIINTVKDLAPDMAFLGVSEEVPGSGGKVLAFAVVPDAVTTSSGLQAEGWVLAALQSCNGRGGGRSGTAQAQAPSCNDVSEVYSAAKLHASSKIESTVT
jgi:alanyl-tRNA synthetase